jgi:hypothetical protein
MYPVSPLPELQLCRMCLYLVKGATAYDDPKMGITYILVLSQAIYLPKDVGHTLLCPNQLRCNGLEVDDIPRHLAPRSKPSKHSIFIPEDGVRLAIRIKGPVSVFDSRTPTPYELETCKWLHLTSDKPWDPHSESFDKEEEKLEFMPELHQQHWHIMSINRNLTDISASFDDLNLLHRSICVISTQKKPSISEEALAQRWGIGLETASKTIQVTTQQGVRNVTGHLECRFKTKQAHSRCPHLSGRHGHASVCNCIQMIFDL